MAPSTSVPTQEVSSDTTPASARHWNVKDKEVISGGKSFTAVIEGFGVKRLWLVGLLDTGHIAGQDGLDENDAVRTQIARTYH